jgi:NitT/TauT family transport system substrate-binding protein
VRTHRSMKYLALVLLVLALVPWNNASAAAPKCQLEKVSWGGGDPVPQLVLGVAKGAGYMEEECVDFNYLDTGGTTNAMRLVETGEIQFGVALPSVMLTATAKANNYDLPLVAIYNYTPGWKYRAIVVPESPIKNIKDLKGKTIGVARMGLSTVPITRSLLSDNGIDPDKDVKWVAVGIGATLIQALKSRVIDAFVGWDTNFGQLDIVGYKYREIPFEAAKGFEFVGATGGLTHRNYLAKRPDIIARVGRAIAKATVFCQANPRAAADIYLKTYPAQIPKGMSYEKALDAVVAEFKLRIELYSHPNLKLGEWSEAGWKNELSMAEIKSVDLSKLDVTKLFTNKFVSAYNDFDREMIVRRAKAWKFDKS